jgi:hypothetical protein
MPDDRVEDRDTDRLEELEAAVAELEELVKNQTESFNTMLNARTSTLAEQTDDHEDRLGELEDIVEDLRDEVTELKLRVSERDENREYEDLTLDEKIGRVREHGFRKAQSMGGMAKLEYSDVMWEVFDGEPGSKHCYKLLRKAAGEDEVEQSDINAGAAGFVFRDPANGNQHLAVDAGLAKRSTAFSPRTKPASEGVPQ